MHPAKLMSYEFKRAGVRGNSIVSGYSPSEMITKESDEDNKSEMKRGKIDAYGHVPMGRAGSDEEMA